MFSSDFTLSADGVFDRIGTTLHTVGFSTGRKAFFMLRTNSEKQTGRGSFLSIRSLVFSALGVFVIAGLSNFHDSVLLGALMVGNALSTGAVVYVLGLGLFWNGAWILLDRAFKTGGRLRGRFALSGGELAVVAIVTLAASYPPTSGLYRYFHRQLMLPWYFLPASQDWISHGLLTEYLRPELFPDPWPGAPENLTTVEYERVYRGFFTGLASGAGTVGLLELPLRAWITPMLRWGPLLLTMALMLTSVQFLVHKQWADHEQLSYPLAQIFGAFTRTDGNGRGIPSLFKNRLFWYGFLPVFLLLLLQYLATWFPQSLPTLKEILPDFRGWTLPIDVKMPFLKNSGNYGPLCGQSIFFTFFGIAYFVSGEVSLTVGLSHVLLTLFALCYYAATGSIIEDSTLIAERSGAYIGYAVILCYTGRSYFKAVFKKAFAPGRAATDSGEVTDVSVLAARTLLLAFAAFTAILAWMCQSWLMALLYAMLILVLYLGISRVVCETGIPFVQSGWLPGHTLVHIFGPAAIGPKPLTFLNWGTSIMAQDPRESLTGFVSTGIKLADDSGIDLKKIFRVIAVAVAAALVVAWFSSVYAMYNYSGMTDGWASWFTPKSYFSETARHFQEMKASGMFGKSLAASPVARLAFVRPDTVRLHYILYGMAAMLLVYGLRFRFSRFPIHPVLFLIIGTMPSQNTWATFLAGWFVKTLVVRFGGGKVYNNLKPAFIGVILGELGVQGLTIVVDFAHYLIFGTPTSIHVSFLPG